MSPTNTATRKHVNGLASIPASGADPDSEIHESSESDYQQAIAIASTSPALPSPSGSPVCSAPPHNLPAAKRASNPTIPPSIPLTTPMPPGLPAHPLLVCSIGNPGPTYASTLHSAGHTILTHIATTKAYQPFRKGLSGLVARPDNTTYSLSLFGGYRKTPGAPPADDNFTFWQSTTLMNVSGAGVKRAWTEYARAVKAQGAEGRLVVVHDELEAGLGKVSVKDGGASARGHNGLKSCQASLGGVKWWRVGVGIGRPESREPDVVSRYVLRKMNRAEQVAMERAAMGVMDALRQISEGKR
ncbi:peptidyl-tRNA hydrolase-domain-containing protein [Massariosphaeria phaeospora]|uniref:peptidyl-tRNA hydrolase n=1 Tax=Massariosphaeria phaeospora TaxID=100035 RepID=A0A7C8I6D0_9PLEO|nr:peptidyl-tRNA hydrolase-domain-containing protein [Massariosphaeria phaeospora]